MDLIIKFLSNDISPKEKKEFEIWLSKSKGNKDLFEEYQTIWLASENYSDNSGYVPDVNAGFRRFKEKTSTAVLSTRQVGNTSIVRRLVFYSAAASLLFMVLGLASWLFISQGNIGKNIVSTKSGETKSVTLKDGSTVVLNQNTKLYYRNNYDETNRVVTLDGEAFFDIKEDQQHPFLVKGNNTEVKVLGTSFNYKTSKKENESSVFVTSGKVQFSGKSNGDAYKFIHLEKNEGGKYDHELKQLEIESNYSDNQIAWKSKKLVFKDTPIDIAFLDIEKFYKINIDYSKSNIKNCKFNSIFDSSPLNEVLENLKHSLNISVTNTSKGNFLITGGRKCK